MTVSYSGSFHRLLCRWRGSVWTAIWREVVAWLILYYVLRFTLEKGCLEKGNKDMVMTVLKTFHSATSEMPIGFMLGFYVTQVLTRWWNQIQSLPWPDESMSLVNAYLTRGDTPDNLHLRRHNIARYLILTQIVALSGVSTRIRKRFPTLKHIVESGLMTPDEHQMLMSCPCANLRWQLPLQWIQNLIVPLVGVGVDLISPTSATSIYRELNVYRANLRAVFMYDWINIPLVITQATGVGLYGYFLVSLLGRQTLVDEFETLIPFGAIVKFCGYVGWFRVAQYLLRPFGEDDDDIELNYLIDRHTNVAMSLAAQPSIKGPRLGPDELFGRAKIVFPDTKLSARLNEQPPPMMATFKFKKDEELSYENVEEPREDRTVEEDGRAGCSWRKREKELTLFF